jgi:hypothetical protein
MILKIRERYYINVVNYYDRQFIYTIVCFEQLGGYFWSSPEVVQSVGRAYPIEISSNIVDGEHAHIGDSEVL